MLGSSIADGALFPCWVSGPKNPLLLLMPSLKQFLQPSLRQLLLKPSLKQLLLRPSLKLKTPSNRSLLNPMLQKPSPEHVGSPLYPFHPKQGCCSILARCGHRWQVEGLLHIFQEVGLARSNLGQKSRRISETLPRIPVRQMGASHCLLLEWAGIRMYFHGLGRHLCRPR